MNPITQLFKFFASKTMTYAGLLDDIVQDFLTDLKSLRYQLIIWAFVYNFYIILASPDNVKWGVGLLTAVYAFYFYSKHQEHHGSALNVVDEEPETDRDPDNI